MNPLDILKWIANRIERIFGIFTKVVGPFFQVAAMAIFLLLTGMATAAFFFRHHFEASIRQGALHDFVELLLKDQASNFLEFVAKQIVENAVGVILTGGGVAALVIVFINVSVRPEMVGPPKAVDDFLQPLIKAMDKAAKIEVADVEAHARNVLRAREKTLENVSRVYSLLYHDFHQLNELMGPDGSPALRTTINRVAIDCTVECHDCDKMSGCTCGTGRYVDIKTTDSETYLETRNRIRSLLDKIAGNRKKLGRELETAFADLVRSLRDAKGEAEKIDVRRLSQLELVLTVMSLMTLTIVCTTLVIGMLLTRH